MAKQYKTLNLVHPKHGIVKSWTFQFLYKCYDSKGVLKIVDRWKKTYGKKFLECETIWDSV